jgi:hypothetical protein
MAHKSQWSERTVRIYGTIQSFLYFSRWIRYTGGRKSDGYRIVTFNIKDHYPKGFAKFMFRLFQNRPIGYKEGHFIPTPEELNLNLHPVGDIT